MTREEIIEYIDMFHIHGDIKSEEMADDLAQPHWIPVSRRRPHEEGIYIVTDSAGGVKTVDTDKYICCDDGEWVWMYSQNVIAWMYLPEPYWGGEQNETD